MINNKLHKIFLIIILCFFFFALSGQTESVYSFEASSILPPIKIFVKEKGMFKVTYDDIESAEWGTDLLDPSKFLLKNQGEDVPILFYGEDAQSFDQGDYFIFYGEPFESDMTHGRAENKFILTNVYWLYPSESSSARIGQVFKQPLNAKTLQDYRETVRLEQDVIMRSAHIDNYYWESFPDYEDEERSDPNSKSFAINLPSVNTAKEANLLVRLKGENNNPDLDPDHHAQIVVNNIFSDDIYFEGWSVLVHEPQIPASTLKEGENTITITNMLGLGAEEDLFRLDWMEIEYSRLFIAQDSELHFTVKAEGRYDVTLSGFSDDSTIIFDITDPLNVLEVQGFSLFQDSDGYSITFGETFDNDTSRIYIALTHDRLKIPDSIELDESQVLKSCSQQADYIMITHEDFYDEIQRLAAHRQKDGYKVMVVKIQDVYDEFNYGIMDPQAIKDFLIYAYNQWSLPAPGFVLLVGDGNSDATDRLELGNKNYIPIKLDRLGNRSVPNDIWYAQVNGDDILSDIVIGRIPAKNNEQLKLIIDRIINYEQSSKAEWMRKALFVSGDIGDDLYFAAMNEQFADDYLPFNYKTYFYNREENDAAKIFDRLNAGKALTVYTGHGNITTWNNIITTSDLSNLYSNEKPTFLITLNCLNGHFSNPQNEGLAEEFLRSPGGGIACFSPVSVGYSFEHQAIAENLLNLLFVDNQTVLGPAVMQAKKDAYFAGRISDSAYEQFIFLGDPATKFKICEFYVTEPADRISISQDTQFNWVADGYSRFIMQFSSTPDFTRWQTLPVFTPKTNYSPKPLIWRILKNMANKNTVVWWRVGGLYSKLRLDDLFDDIEEKAAFTEPLSFTINK